MISKEQIESVFKAFNVHAKVVNIIEGELATRFEIEIAPGVTTDKVLRLADEVALAVKARIPIMTITPERGTIAMDFSKMDRKLVTFKSMIHPEDSEKIDDLPIRLGKNTMGDAYKLKLAKMPHLIIAGTTGSGKSVCEHVMINYLLSLKNHSMIRFLMIDPKRVELFAYKDLPHLMCPIITEMNLAAQTLDTLVDEMERRYDLLARHEVMKLSEYNKDREKKLPYIVGIIDEYADLVMTNKNVEKPICRIAQKGRAAGIHLVLATQRPSTDVVTGLVKANFPSRIAFNVSTGMDSRVIIDRSGAEQLLGKGDGLVLAVGDNDIERIQCAYIGMDEIKESIREASETFDPDICEEYHEPTEIEDEDEADDETIIIQPTLSKWHRFIISKDWFARSMWHKLITSRFITSRNPFIQFIRWHLYAFIVAAFIGIIAGIISSMVVWD